MAKAVVKLNTPNLENQVTAKLLGEAIKARRTQSLIRLEDAAALCGVAKQTLQDIEKGHENTQLVTLLKVCSGLGISLRIMPWSSDDEGFNE